MQNLRHFIWPSIKKYRLEFFFFTILICSWSLENSFIPLVLGEVVDGFVSCLDSRSVAWDTVGKSVLTYLGLWIFVHFFCRIGGFVRASLLPKFAADIRMRTFEAVGKKSYSYFVNHLSGDISGKIYLLQEKVTNLFDTFINLLFPSIISLIFATLLFRSVKNEIAIALCFWLMLHIFTCVVLGSRCSKYEEVHSSANNLLNGRIVDCIANHFIWKIFVSEKFEYENVSRYQEKELIAAQRSQRYIAKLHAVLSVLSLVFSVCGINILGYYYWQCGDISVGDFVFIINAVLNIEMLVWSVGLQLPTVFADIGACKQAFSVISEDSHVRDIANARDLIVEKGEITFRNVSFGYNQDLIFDNLSIKIKPGEKIGLVGYSGSGKTTFCNLILRLYDVKSGKILIDNQNIAEVTQESLRGNISVVPQDPVLFHRSLLENIKYGNMNTTSKEIKEAAKKARIADLLDKKEETFDVGEGGNKISKGERQRVAIARAILKNAKILFLDEATSALDSISENAIQKSLDGIVEGKTVIAIAHRLTTLKKMDRIFVFDKGKIVEVGTHNDLLERKSLYHQLWESQKEGFIGV